MAQPYGYVIVHIKLRGRDLLMTVKVLGRQAVVSKLEGRVLFDDHRTCGVSTIEHRLQLPVESTCAVNAVGLEDDDGNDEHHQNLKEGLGFCILDCALEKSCTT